LLPCDSKGKWMPQSNCGWKFSDCFAPARPPPHQGRAGSGSQPIRWRDCIGSGNSENSRLRRWSANPNPLTTSHSRISVPDRVRDESRRHGPRIQEMNPVQRSPASSRFRLRSGGKVVVLLGNRTGRASAEATRSGLPSLADMPVLAYLSEIPRIVASLSSGQSKRQRCLAAKQSKGRWGRRVERRQVV